MLWQLLVLTLCIWLAYYRWQRRRLYNLCKEIPLINIKSYPVIGIAHLFIGNSEDHLKGLQIIGSGTNEKGGLATGWVANKLYVCLTDPVAAEVVLKTCLDKDDTTVKYLRDILGNGHAFASVDIWHPRRKILARVFNIQNLNGFVSEFARQAEITTSLLERKVGKGDISLWNYISTFTFDTICSTNLGVDLRAQHNNDHPFLQALAESLSIIGMRTVSPWLHWDFIFERLPYYKKLVHARTVLYNFADDLIKKKRKEIADRDSGMVTEAKRKTFLDMLIEYSGGENGFSDVELREETLSILLAGSDTTAVTISFTLVMLSRYPEIQEKTYQELQEVFGDSDHPMTVADLPKLVYMEAVIKETLRLYPAAPIYLREVFNDVKLPSGQTLVEGVGILVNLYGIHRNKKYWGEDVDVFRPERFLEGPLKHPAQFIPFSYSIRNCLGKTYGMMSMKTVLSAILRNYRLLPPSDLDPEDWTKPLRVKYNVMLRHIDNFVVRLEYREK